ncbi:MAG TPA: hypothetical protein VMT35_10115 [Ignavibacteriaceae bacterium]|nr:hypothetical protein [Ignavibacteriaceae bacterium]
MRSNIIALMILFTAINIYAQKNSDWGKLHFLIGTWKGEGSGKPGEGEGYFSFKFDLENKIMIRNSHSEYPAAKDKPLIVHNDLMIIYLNYSGNPEKAIYFDNEGHVINYSITFPKDDIIFTSDKVPNSPVFRLTYSKIQTDLMNVKFEMSQDGENYTTYVEGKSKRQQ